MSVLITSGPPVRMGDADAWELENQGGSAIYYGTASNVAPGTAEGSVSATEKVVLTGPYYLVCGVGQQATASYRNVAQVVQSLLVGSSSATGTTGLPLLAGIADVPELYGAKGDGIAVYDATMTSGSNVWSSATHICTTADIGKLVVVWGAAAAATTAFGQSAPGTLAGYIGGISSGNALITSDAAGTTPLNASTTVAAATSVFGTDDTAALNACYLANSGTESGGMTSGTSGFGTVRHRAVRYCFSAEVVVSGLCNTLGQGIRTTHFECMTATASVRFDGRGGTSGGWNIHGNYIARWPMSWGKQDGTTSVTQRHFDSFEVKFAGPGVGSYTRSGLWSGLLYSGNAQNVKVTNCELGYSYGDGFVNDLGSATHRFKSYEIERCSGYHVKFVRSINTGSPNDHSFDGGVIERVGYNNDGQGMGSVYVGSGAVRIENTSIASSSAGLGGYTSDASYPNPNPNLTQHMMACLVEKLATAAQAYLTIDRTTVGGGAIAYGDTALAVGDQGILKVGTAVTFNAFQVLAYAANTAIITGLDRTSSNSCGGSWVNGTGTTSTGAPNTITAVTQPFQIGDRLDASGAGIAAAIVKAVSGTSGNWTLTISGVGATSSGTGVALTRGLGNTITRNSVNGLLVGNVAINSPALPPTLPLVNALPQFPVLGELSTLTNPSQIDALVTATDALNGSPRSNQLGPVALCTYGSKPAIAFRAFDVWSFTFLPTVQPNGLPQDAPTNALAATYDRSSGSADTSPLTSGTLLIARSKYVVAAGQTVTAGRFASGSVAAVTPTHQWMCVVDPATMLVVAVSADLTTTAIGADAISPTYTFGSTWTPLAATVPLIGLMIVAGTMPRVANAVMRNGTSGATAPVLAGNYLTSQTTPPAVGAAVGAVTGQVSGVPFMWLT